MSVASQSVYLQTKQAMKINKESVSPWKIPILKTPADPKHEIDKSYTYGKLFFLWI